MSSDSEDQSRTKCLLMSHVSKVFLVLKLALWCGRHLLLVHHWLLLLLLHTWLLHHWLILHSRLLHHTRLLHHRRSLHHTGLHVVLDRWLNHRLFLSCLHGHAFDQIGVLLALTSELGLIC